MGTAFDGTAGSERDRRDLVEAVERAVCAHPSVSRLDGGEFSVIASPLAGRMLVGVRLRESGRAEVGVVLRLDQPLPQTVAQVRSAVEEITGAPVDLVVSDVVTVGDQR